MDRIISSLSSPAEVAQIPTIKEQLRYMEAHHHSGFNAPLHSDSCQLLEACERTNWAPHPDDDTALQMAIIFHLCPEVDALHAAGKLSRQQHRDIIDAYYSLLPFLA